MNENLSRFKSRTLPHSYQKISSQYLHIDCIKFQPYIETHGDMDTKRTVCLLNINNGFLQMHFFIHIDMSQTVHWHLYINSC